MFYFIHLFFILPNVKRNALEEYKLNHITDSIFFDIDKNTNQNSNLPHMLPSAKEWEKIISNLGISNSDHVIVYDNSDVFSSCRVWYTFLYFGHNPNQISIVDGNFEKWKNEKRSISTQVKKINRSNYAASENSQLVLNKDQINENLNSKKFQLIDARGEKRFLGLQPEPRKELKSGNIKGSKNLGPISQFVRDLSKNVPVLYGLFSIVLALVLGVGAAILRRFLSNLKKKYVYTAPPSSQK